MEATKILEHASQRDDLITIEATVVTGFEFLACDECREKCDPYNLIKTRGRLFFNIPLTDFNKVTSLRSVDNVYMLFKAIPTVGFQNDKEKDLELVKDLVEQVDWAKYLEKWSLLKSFTGKIFPKTEEVSDEDVVRFRATCYRSGKKHSFSSMEAARDFGGALNDKFHWKVDLTNFDLEVVLNIVDSVAYIGAAMTSESLHRRNITHFSATTLRATLCYCLVRLTEPLPGEIVLDPLCGTGSIPLEASLGFPYLYAFGGERKKESVEKAAKNISAIRFLKPKSKRERRAAKKQDVAKDSATDKPDETLANGEEKPAEEEIEEIKELSVTGDKEEVAKEDGLGEEEPEGGKKDTAETKVVDEAGGDPESGKDLNLPSEPKTPAVPIRPGVKADVLRWSVRNLPLRNSCIDVFVTDLPFGKRSGQRKDNLWLYKDVLWELARVVRPKTGRASILTADTTAMSKAIYSHTNLWKQVAKHNVNQGGIYATVYLLLRSANIFSEEK